MIQANFLPCRGAWLAPILLAVALAAGPSSAAETALGDRVWVSPLSPHIWIIRSEFDFRSFGTVSSNALVVAGETGSLLIDTPVTVAQTERVLAWAEQTLKKPVERVIATHAHEDRLGGLAATDRRGIPSHAIARTMELARQRGYVAPRHALKREDTVSIPGVTVHTYFPGHGHTEDNIVVWIPVDLVLHGGCFVKGADARNLGNLEEIDPRQWKPAAEDVLRRYPKAAIVVPGHGAPAGLDLLRHTLFLIREHEAASRPAKPQRK